MSGLPSISLQRQRFSSFSGLHLFFNWRVFVYYFKSRRAKGLHLKKEMALATTITVLYVVGTVTNAPPLAHILRGNDWFKVYWERTSTSGPVAHAEELTLEGIGERVNFSAEEVLTQIIAAGYEVPDPSATFGEIAEANGTSPDALYQTLFPSKGRGRQGRGFGGRGGCTEDLAEDTKETCEIAGDSHTQEAPHSQSLQRGSGGGGGRGLGQMTLAQLCQEESVDMETALARLREQNIEASGDHPIREIANQLGMHPRDILGFITQTNTADHPK